MSTPRCILAAIHACRPHKFSSSQTALLLPTRSLSSATRSHADSLLSPADSSGKSSAPSRAEELTEGCEEDPVEAEGASQEGEGEKAVYPIRSPRNVTATYLRPLRRQAQYGMPSCDLQLRSYSVRNVEFMADFAMRAAYYLGLPASGPVPLPRIRERWTMPKSNFVHKKVQENFERVTLRRLIQIKDGHPETVQVWLAFLRKHAFYGVGMKANVWQHESLEVGKSMDKAFSEIEHELDERLSSFGWNKNVAPERSVLQALVESGLRDMGMGMTDVREASQTREQRI